MHFGQYTATPVKETVHGSPQELLIIGKNTKYGRELPDTFIRQLVEISVR